MNVLLAPIALAVVIAIALAAELPAQAQWQMQGGRMRAKVAHRGKHAVTAMQELAPGERVAIAPGDMAVHFASNANGKPASLTFSVEDGARVNVAVADAGPANRSELRLGGDGAYLGPLSTLVEEPSIQVSTTGSTHDERRDYRVSMTCELMFPVGEPPSGHHTILGIVARHHPDRGCYLLSIDCQQKKVRLERWMGGDHMVMREVDVPGLQLAARHTLTIEVNGFRLQGFLDDELLVRTFDGALTAGAPGMAWAGAPTGPGTGPRPLVEGMWMEPPAPPLASAALVQVGNRATLHASAPVAPGHWHVLELALDRPHAFVPRSPARLEPCLMQPWAAPIILWSDWRNSLGRNGISELGGDGRLSSELVWPELPALRHRCALVRALLIQPGGQAIVATTPSVRVIF